MKRKLSIYAILFVVAMAVVFMTTINTTEAGRGDGPVIYVTSQGLYYDSIVTTQLPRKGPFQELYECDQGLCTEFGPGDPGYKGGRWWMDVYNNGEMDESDNYFSCPLLPPGRETP